MKQFTFEDLPKIIARLSVKMDRIEKLLRDRKSSNPDSDKELLTIEQASKLLTLSVATIYSKVCRNEIPVNKQGKRLYFYRTELLDWIKSGRIKTISEIQREVEVNFKSKQSGR